MSRKPGSQTARREDSPAFRLVPPSDRLRRGSDQVSKYHAGQSAVRSAGALCERPEACNRSSTPPNEIADALKLADELKLKLILSGATDAWKLADEIKKRNVASHRRASDGDATGTRGPYDAPFANPAKLHAPSTILYAIRGRLQRPQLAYNAAMAISYGLPAEEGLKSVTLYPAQSLASKTN